MKHVTLISSTRRGLHCCLQMQENIREQCNEKIKILYIVDRM